MAPTRTPTRPAGDAGTASVELIAVVPLLLLAVLVSAQLALAGQALWSSAVAARAGARAALVGRDPETAARRVLPPAMRSGARVGVEGSVSDEVRVPRLLPVLPPVKVGSSSGLGAGG